MAGRQFPGIHAVLYAFFDAEGRLDRAAMKQQVEAVIRADVDGITVLGLATEVLKLNEAERRCLIDWTIADTANRVPVSVTISGNSVMDQVELAAHAEAAGADWLILQPPMVGNYHAQEYTAFFETVGRGLSLPWAIQNAPAYLGRSLGAQDIADLRSRAPLFNSIKAESSAVAVHGLIAQAGERMCVFNGRGGLEMIDNLRAGCAGFVLAPDAIDFAVRTMRYWRAGQEHEAERTHRLALPAINFIMDSLETLICYGKRIFADRVGLTVHDRAPAMRPDAFGFECARRHAEALGRWPYEESA
ncbi:MAG: dihydrodipicolinate synthase family protein [Roseitalea porphyridii]|jgi:2-keto-3-deoxy-L-arabinonate dehydratase|uniref:dihydrodipicolinate synthase family protein n=1 Tax=Alphaproteobacteria TaxID=28211 RepID=UPI0032EAA6ED